MVREMFKIAACIALVLLITTEASILKEDGSSDIEDDIQRASCKCDNGFCEKNDEGKDVCKCPPEFGPVIRKGYSVTKCKKCSCGEGINCTFDYGFFVDTQICVCREGYKYDSKTCKGDCSGTPCKNSGKCSVKGNDIACKCSGGFSGDFCETDPCASITCKNGGVCSFDQIAEKAICKCKAPFFGDLCENECKCENGKCQDVGGVLSCVCNPGNSFYEKGVCKECDCGKGSNCTFDGKPKKKTCVCPTDFKEFKGKCTECKCDENGKCQDVGGVLTCVCNPGHGLYNKGVCKVCDCGKGSNCTFDANTNKKTCICQTDFKEFNGKCTECKCDKNGKCQDVGGVLTCVCNPGHGLYKKGVCKECECGNDFNCTFGGDTKKKTCICPADFEEIGGICKGCECSDGKCEKNEEGKAVCKCPPEYGPVFREGHPVTKCKKCYCGKGINCTLEYGTWSDTVTCVCREGYKYDSDSETCKGDCSGAPCKNGGECSVNGSGIACKCAGGFSGDFCETTEITASTLPVSTQKVSSTSLPTFSTTKASTDTTSGIKVNTSASTTGSSPPSTRPSTTTKATSSPVASTNTTIPASITSQRNTVSYTSGNYSTASVTVTYTAGPNATVNDSSTSTTDTSGNFSTANGSSLSTTDTSANFSTVNDSSLSTTANPLNDSSIPSSSTPTYLTSANDSSTVTVNESSTSFTTANLTNLNDSSTSTYLTSVNDSSRSTTDTSANVTAVIDSSTSFTTANLTSLNDSSIPSSPTPTYLTSLNDSSISTTDTSANFTISTTDASTNFTAVNDSSTFTTANSTTINDSSTSTTVTPANLTTTVNDSSVPTIGSTAKFTSGSPSPNTSEGTTEPYNSSATFNGTTTEGIHFNTTTEEMYFNTTTEIVTDFKSTQNETTDSTTEFSVTETTVTDTGDVTSNQNTGESIYQSTATDDIATEITTVFTVLDRCPLMLNKCIGANEICVREKCVCKEHFKRNYRNECIPNYCESSRGYKCGENSECEEVANDPGNVKCVCEENYFFNGQSCVRANKCDLPGTLGCVQICNRDTESCECRDQFTLQSDKKNCTIENGSKTCDTNCSGVFPCILSKEAEPVCVCPPTHVASGMDCVDICTAKKLPKGVCPNDECFPDDLLGFICKCEGRLTYDKNGVTCREKLMCSEGNGTSVCSEAFAKCIEDSEHENGFRCECEKGEEMDTDGYCKSKCELRKYVDLCDKKAATCEMEGTKAKCKCPPMVSFNDAGKCADAAEFSYVGSFPIAAENYISGVQMSPNPKADTPNLDYSKIREDLTYSMSRLYRIKFRSVSILDCSDTSSKLTCTAEVQFNADPEDRLKTIGEACIAPLADNCIIPPSLVLRKKDVTPDILSRTDPCMQLLKERNCGGIESVCTKVDSDTINYICECAGGYYSSRKYYPVSDRRTVVHNCQDVDECLSPESCPNGTKCVNTPGSYECPCGKGYRLLTANANPKETGCADICKPNPCGNGKCQLDDFYYKCSCDDGYVGSGCNMKVAPQESNGMRAALIILSTVVVPLALLSAFMIHKYRILLRKFTSTEYFDDNTSTLSLLPLNSGDGLKSK